jgi:A/G-specific adenine glycosylase
MSSNPRTGKAAALLEWYDRVARDLPWRRAPSPYKTLVSEFMLQQTVVATVAPFFDRFVARFPEVRALAAAAEDEVSALWSGLGYYTRARNLHRAAREVVERHGGEIPRDEETLRALPGVGPYTAAAVAAIAFGARTFALDANAGRVMARLHGVAEPVDRPATRARLQQLGQGIVPPARAGDFAQAVMELGATVCVPRAPRCERCPLAAACQARRDGTAAALPVKSPKRARPVVRVACACVVRAGRVLLVRRDAGLLAGTWTLPSATIDGAGPPAAARAAARGAGVAPVSVAHRGQVRHVFTHRDVTADVFTVSARGTKGGQGRWVSPDALGSLGISTFTRKTLAVGLSARRAKAAPPPQPIAGGAEPFERSALGAAQKRDNRVGPT